MSYLSPAYGGSDVTINIPTFLKKRNRMSGITVQRDSKISSKRVHNIEQVIGLANTFKILIVTLNRTETRTHSSEWMLAYHDRCWT